MSDHVYFDVEIFRLFLKTKKLTKLCIILLSPKVPDKLIAQKKAPSQLLLYGLKIYPTKILQVHTVSVLKWLLYHCVSNGCK